MTISKTKKYLNIFTYVLIFNAGIIYTDAKAALPGKGSFWDKSAEGYWWYAIEPEEQDNKQTEEPPQTVVKTEHGNRDKADVYIHQTPQQLLPAPIEIPAPKVGSAQWIKENLESYRQLAIDNPTVANVRAYMYVQRLAMDRAEQFALAGKKAVEGDPFLDEVTNAPLGGSLTLKRRAYIGAEKERLIRKLTDKVGVFFIFKDVCYMCELQAGVLKMASEQYGLHVKAVSLDEPSKDNKIVQQYPDYVINPNIAKQLGIVALPSLFYFVGETEEIKPLLQGVVTLADLLERFVDSAEENHWLPEKDFYYTRAATNPTSLSEMFGSDNPFIDKLQQQGGPDPYGNNTNFVDPVKLVEMIREEKFNSIPDDYIPRGY